MAGTMLSIAPLLVFYFVLQRQFVESVDKSGITGE
jgi:multiple sugar transport system permease protein